MRHGDNGRVRGAEDEALFRYCVPRCELTGKIFYQGVSHSVTQGQGTYAHAFGSGVVFLERLVTGARHVEVSAEGFVSRPG